MLNVKSGICPAFRKDKTAMKKMKREDIDKMITESLQETGSDNILQKFSDNLSSIISIQEESGSNMSDRITIFLSGIMTAQMNAVSTIREVLYKLFCEDETEDKCHKSGGKDVFN